MATAIAFKEAIREQRSVTASFEKRVLVWMAARVPARINSDHLTGLGFAAMLAAAAVYPFSHEHTWLLHAANLALALNWFGDSLDGTLARHRQRLRPRYGFYVDHICDTIGIFALVAGLSIAGYLTPVLGMLFVAVYFMLCINIFLATYTIGTFQMSFWKFGPTEFRIALAVGNIALIGDPHVQALGTRFPLFDVGAAVAIVGMTAMLLTSVAKNVAILYEAERI